MSGSGSGPASQPARAKIAARAEVTSDVTRPRELWIAGAAACVASVIALAVVSRHAPLGSPGALSRPHAKAQIACATCHGNQATQAGGPSAVCASCHGKGTHASTREAHRALAGKGELTCATCHPAHSGAQGVLFADDGTYVRWGNGAEASGRAPEHAPAGQQVALVSARACGTCHDLANRRDPVATCLASGTNAALCFDEHQRVDAIARPVAGGVVCAKEHGDTRYLAWAAAREVARSTPWVSPIEDRGNAFAPVGVGLVFGTGALGLLAARRRFGAKSREKQRKNRLPLAPAERRRLPQIDTTTCLGCYACVDVCPFDVLEIDRYVAVVARPDECCGVVLCEQVCPNGSLKITEGEPIEERALTDEHLESKDVPGVFVAGDLSGLPLIKNAINQGARVADRIAATLPSAERAKRANTDDVDVAILGAGPAGLSAALRAGERGLSCVVLEQATVAASIRSFPREKLVFDQPLDLPVEGALWLRESTKDELLAQWTRIVRARKLPVREGHRVVNVSRDGARFVVVAVDASGVSHEVRAARVILAIGRRGTPRALPLDVADGAEDRVSTAFIDARAFNNKRVLIVGLGDTAMEAAIALARQPGTKVSLVHRGSAFTRGKARNIAEVQRLAAAGVVDVSLETHPIRVERESVEVEQRGVRRRIATDAVLVLIGGEPSWDLLGRIGLKRTKNPGTIAKFAPL